MSWKSSWFPFRHEHRHPVLARAHDTRTFGERVADRMASFGGSWPFVLFLVGLIGGWMVLNTVILQKLLGSHPLDAFPYILLNLGLSALAGLQAPIIMMSQNRAAARDEVLAAHHYEETQKLNELIRQNTGLTERVKTLTEELHQHLIKPKRKLRAKGSPQ